MLGNGCGMVSVHRGRPGGRGAAGIGTGIRTGVAAGARHQAGRGPRRGSTGVVPNCHDGAGHN